MRISDWGSDVCSSDRVSCSSTRSRLRRKNRPRASISAIASTTSFTTSPGVGEALSAFLVSDDMDAHGSSNSVPCSASILRVTPWPWTGSSRISVLPDRDRKSVVSGQSVSERVDLGGRRIIKKKKKVNEKQVNIKK